MSSKSLEKKLIEKNNGLLSMSASRDPIELNLKDKEKIFVLSYDDYGIELIIKNNELFKGTNAEIPLHDEEGNFLKGEIEGVTMLRRMALTTTIYSDEELREKNYWPITPLEYETMLKDNLLDENCADFESIALVLYKKKYNTFNGQEARALYKSIKENREELNLGKKDLKKNLLVINAGLQITPHTLHYPFTVNKEYLMPKLLPGLTEVYAHEFLNDWDGRKYKFLDKTTFDYGLNHGLPNVEHLDGPRRISRSHKHVQGGLKTIHRYSDHSIIIGLPRLHKDFDFLDYEGFDKATFINKNFTKK